MNPSSRITFGRAVLIATIGIVSATMGAIAIKAIAATNIRNSPGARVDFS